MNLKINTSKLQEIIEGLKKEIANLEKAYKDIETNMEKIDGTHDLWKSTSQKITYEYFQDLQKNFNNSIENIKNLKKFLEKTIENYNGSVETNKNNIDDNDKNLDIN